MVTTAGYANPRVFKVGVPALVTRGFVHAGVAYKVGDVFPYAELKLTAFELYGLWLASLIDTRQASPIQTPSVVSEQPRPKFKHRR